MNTNEFYWPVSIKQIQRMGDDFNNNLFTKINKFKCEHKKDLVITIFAPLHNEILTLMTHLIVFNSKKKISYSNLFYSKKSRIAKSLIENRLPEKTYTENLLIKGFNENYFISIMKKLKSLIFNKYPTNSLKSVDLNNDIITIHTGDVIETHIKDKGQKVFYVPTNEWFKTLKKENNFYLENKKIIFLKNFIENQIFDLFNKYNVKSTNLINIYIKDLIFNLLKESNNYLGYIIENKIAPKILWTSSGGSLFTKIIRLSSKVCGGKVFGHDHSHGQGPFKNFVNSYIETNFLDEFYVRTAQQKYNLERELRGSRLKNEKLIIKISKNTQQKILKKKIRNEKSVMLVSSLYNVDSSFLEPLPFASAMLDWEIRTLRYLQSIGYVPIYKPHPESKVDFTKFFENMGFEVNLERFEQAYSQASILLFGVPNATSFFFSFKTNIPMVLIDLGTKKWNPQALKSLKKRVGYIKTKFDKNNKVLLDWNSLKRELKKSKGLKDNEFAKTFFYPSLV